MKRVLQRLASWLWPVATFYLLVIKKNAYLTSTGWVKSLKRGVPCRPDGSPLPWMNYAVIAFLQKRLHKGLELFEYGSGYSTMFYAGLVKSVTSVEGNAAWYETVKNKVPANAQVMFREQDKNGEYCRAITAADRKFDVVVVDGRDRVNCIKQSLLSLSPQGVLILDDSHRERYQEIIAEVAAQGFRVLDFEGLKPAGWWNYRTTVFYRSDNCLGI